MNDDDTTNTVEEVFEWLKKHIEDGVVTSLVVLLEKQKIVDGEHGGTATDVQLLANWDALTPIHHHVGAAAALTEWLYGDMGPTLEDLLDDDEDDE
jgi:hypothetical protein